MLCQAPAPKPATGDAFEDVLYGSESELDDSDDGAPTQSGRPSKKKQQEQGARLRMDDDEPMDLLAGAASRITSADVSLCVLLALNNLGLQMQPQITAASQARMHPVSEQTRTQER